jgi:hypothetical protein
MRGLLGEVVDAALQGGRAHGQLPAAPRDLPGIHRRAPCVVHQLGKYFC